MSCVGRRVVMALVACLVLSRVSASESEVELEAHTEASRPPTYDVIIVGAGLSGLNAAYRLVKVHGLDPNKVLVLEARNRFGGRTYSPIIKRLDGSPGRRDYGAEFTSPTAYRLMGYQDKFGLKRSVVYQEKNAIFEDSSFTVHTASKHLPLPMPLGAKLDYLGGLFSFSQLYKNVNLREIHKSKDAEKLDKDTLAGFATQHFKNSAAREFFVITMAVAYGSPPEDISLLQLLHFTKSCGGMTGLLASGKWHLKGGSQQVSEGIVADGGFRMILNSPVMKIERNDKKVTVFTRHDPDAQIDEKGVLKPPPPHHKLADYSVKSKSGSYFEEEFTAKQVILAVPLPFAHNITFVPPMPEGRQRLTEAAYMATYTKVHLVCPKRTWKFMGGFASKGPFPLFADTSHPAEDNMDEAMITGFFVPPSSYEVKKMTPDARRAAVFAQLRRMLKDDHIDEKVCYYHEKEWDDDPWAKGVTVVIKPGILYQYGQYLTMPVGSRIKLGGSETAPVWNGYMEGALESGERTAAEAFASLQCMNEMATGVAQKIDAHYKPTDCKLLEEFGQVSSSDEIKKFDSQTSAVIEEDIEELKSSRRSVEHEKPQAPEGALTPNKF